jgi:hypothetical protein
VSGRQRVTNFNETDYSVVGELTFDAANPHGIYAGAARDPAAKEIDAYKVVLGRRARAFYGS